MEEKKAITTARKEITDPVSKKNCVNFEKEEEVKIKTEVNQSLVFEKGEFANICEVDVSFRNGYLRTFSFEYNDRRVVINDYEVLKDIHTLIDKVVEFIDNNDEAKVTIEKSKTRLIR